MDQRGWIACDHQVTSHLFSSPLNDEWRWTALQRLFILCGLKRILTSLNFLRAHLLAPNEIRRSRRTTRTAERPLWTRMPQSRSLHPSLFPHVSFASWSATPPHCRTHGAAHPRRQGQGEGGGSGRGDVCLLLDLSHDEQSIVTHELCDPLRPLLAVHLSSTAKGLWVPMQEQLAELRQRHAEAAAMARAWGTSCAALADATQLELGEYFNKPLTLAHWRTLGMLVGCGSLPRLVSLGIINDDSGDEGVVSLADGLRRGRLPSLRNLWLANAQIGPQGATALAPALTKRALPSLEELCLYDNPLGDAGLAALLPALCRLPQLKELELIQTNIGDEGLASLVAQPTAGALKSLERLWLNRNQISDAGCATLASALRGGALPALKRLLLVENPASHEAQNAVHAARPGVGRF